jgi:protein-L-isoaspartate(D-aspartate) O-methyltransferase
VTAAQASRLADVLDVAGAIPADWKQAFAAAPRHLFIPEVIWIERADGPGWRPLSRHDDPDGWWAAVNADGYIVTQVDDGRPPAPGAVGEYSTSSASQPSLVLRMLQALGVLEGQRVLEVGTGTGWNAALLSARLGEDAVTTIEVDPALAETASTTLAAARFHPTVVTGDGAAGHPPGAPYDRIISTASVRRIPQAWLEQTRPGGRILTPYGTPYSNDALLELTVHPGGSAGGRFIGRAAFMWMRHDRVLVGALRDYVHPGDPVTTSITQLDPRAVFGHPDADFAIGTRVPDVSWHRFDAADGSGEFTIWLLDVTGEGRSWASVDHEHRATHTVEQHGPRRLWDEVEAAHRWWTSNGRPGLTRFGLTVTPDEQCVWLDTPTGPSWPIGSRP